jgi:hypothetical protein
MHAETTCLADRTIVFSEHEVFKVVSNDEFPISLAVDSF